MRREEHSFFALEYSFFRERQVMAPAADRRLQYLDFFPCWSVVQSAGGQDEPRGDGEACQPRDVVDVEAIGVV
jgi:hypothetical protein